MIAKATRLFVGAVFFAVLFITISLLTGCPKKPANLSSSAPSQPSAPSAPSQPLTPLIPRFWERGQVDEMLVVFLRYLQRIRTERRQPLFYIVLIDETGVEAMPWDDAIQRVKQIIRYMGVRDKITIIGIDYRSTDALDVRLSIRTAPEEEVLLGLFKKKLIEEVKGITPRPVPRYGSDIVGALWHANRFASSVPSHIPVVIAFSDMKDQDEEGREIYLRIKDNESVVRRIGHFPNGTEGAFFYVTTSDERLIDFWYDIFREVGINIAPINP
jgi:hypothetical protein